MSIATTANFTEEAISKLQELHTMSVDSYNGLLDAADLVNNQEVAEVFQNLARERQQNAQQLEETLRKAGHEVDDSQSVQGKLHQMWMSARGKLSSGDAYAVLAEAERGEDHIKDAYENALTEVPGTPANAMLQQQFAGVKAGHDRIRDMRDSHKED